MSEFKNCLIGDIAEIIGGGTPSTKNKENFGGDISWITPKDLSDHRAMYISKGERSITKIGLENSSAKLLPANSILFTSRAPIGYVALAKNEITTNQGFKSLILKDDNDPKFFYYLLKNITPQIKSYASGSTFQEISGKVLGTIPIKIPSSKSQKRIGEFIEKFDKKIELNYKHNHTLEEIAKVLFKSWFIDFDPVKAKVEGRSTGLPNEISDLFPDSFERSEIGEIPKNWEIKCLDQLTDFVIGGDWGKDEISNQFPSRVLCIRGADIPDLQNFGYGNMPTRFIKLDSFHKRSLNDGDIIFEISGGSPTQSTGRPVLVEKKLFERFDIPLMCSNFCRIIRLKSNDLSPFIYYFLKHLYDKEEMFMYETGTTGIKNFGYNYFASSRQFTIPDQKLLSIYTNHINQMRDSSNLRGTQSRTLSEIRDILIPKLLSGELSIPDAEKIFEDGEI